MHLHCCLNPKWIFSLSCWTQQKKIWYFTFMSILRFVKHQIVIWQWCGIITHNMNGYFYFLHTIHSVLQSFVMKKKATTYCDDENDNNKDDVIILEIANLYIINNFLSLACLHRSFACSLQSCVKFYTLCCATVCVFSPFSHYLL